MAIVPFPIPHKADRPPAFRILRALPRVVDSHPFFRIIHGKSRIECAVLAAHHVSKIFLFHLFLLAAGGKRAPDCLHLGVRSLHGHACRRPRLQTAVLLPLYCIQTIKEMPAALITAQKAFLSYFHIFSCHSDNRCFTAVVRKLVDSHQGNRFFTLCHCSVFRLSHKVFLAPVQNNRGW